MLTKNQLNGFQEIGGKTLVGASPAFLRMLEQVRAVAPLDVTAFLVGERGTGKSTIAAVIRALSRRAAAPYHELNCAAIPENLIESELFGSVKGAFSEAQNRKGLFQECHGGTLFLDEIGDMSDALQAKLLRVLETGIVKRVGSNQTESCNVRLICATNKALDGLRQDLIDRIDEARITMPPLRERREDLPKLIEYGFTVAQRKISRQSSFRLDPVALKVLCEYAWPGNIRQLGNVVLQIALNCKQSEIILPADVGAVLRRRESDQTPPLSLGEAAASLTQNSELLFCSPSYRVGEPLDHYYARVLLSMYENLAAFGKSHSEIARLLGMDRTTLYSRLRQARAVLKNAQTAILQMTR